MRDMIERPVATSDRDENILALIIFPCNEEDLKEQFQVKDIDKLYFVDFPESKLSISAFNHAMLQAEIRAKKIRSNIASTSKFIKDKMAMAGCPSATEEIPLNFFDSIVWNWCMKEDYKHMDDNFSVWYHNHSLILSYKSRK